VTRDIEFQGISWYLSEALTGNLRSALRRNLMEFVPDQLADKLKAITGGLGKERERK
jgi:hypothetical protein